MRFSLHARVALKKNFTPVVANRVEVRIFDRNPTQPREMNHEQLTSLFTRMHMRLHRIGASMLGLDADVEDALQDTFCKVWTRSESFAEEAHAEAYTVTAMRSACIDSIRRRRDSADIAQCGDIADTSSSEPDSEEIYRDVMTIVNSRLPEMQRIILNMRDVQGLSYAEIAETLGMEQAAVRMALSRARKAVREIYNKQFRV